MNITAITEQLLRGQDLPKAEMQNTMRAIMTGNCTDSQIAGFLVALRAKGECVSEITAAAKIMRELSNKVTINSNNLVDIVGTGGDTTGTFNISTVVSFVVAATGATVAKHGNRSVSSNSGSADLLETAGVKLDLTAEQVKTCIQKIGIGFMFAPMHHSAMKYAINARKELGIRTIFNLLGPLTNPASAKRQLTGVFAKQWLMPFAEVLRNLGSEQVMLVHSEDGMDEVSISAPTFVTELKNDHIETYTITPEQFGFEYADLSKIQVSNPSESMAMIKRVLNNEPCPATDIVCLNAACGIYVSGITSNIEDGVIKAKQTLKNGAALAKFEQLKQLSNSI